MSRLTQEIDKQTLLVTGYRLIPQHVPQHIQEIVSLISLGTLLVTQQDSSPAYSRTRVSSYAGDFVGNYSRDFIGNFSRNFVGNYSRDFAGNYVVSIQEIRLVHRLEQELRPTHEHLLERELRPTLVRQPVLVLRHILEIVRQTLLYSCLCL